MKKENTNNTVETFEGIRKDNARKIFGILMIVLILDFIYDIAATS